MFRRDLELTADMITDKLLEKFIVFIVNEVVEANTRTDKDLFDFGERTDAAKQMQILAVVDHEVFAGLGRKAFSALAHTAFFLSLAGGRAEVCGRAADVMDITLEIGHFGEDFGFFQNRSFTSRCDGSALVVSDGAEIASAVAAADMVDGEFDFFDGGNTAERFIRRMIISFVGKIENVIELFCFERRRRGILNDDFFAVALNDRFASYGIVFILLNTAGARIC